LLGPISTPPTIISATAKALYPAAALELSCAELDTPSVAIVTRVIRRDGVNKRDALLPSSTT